MSLWDPKEGPGVSPVAKVFRVGSNVHFGWENHAYAILQSLYEQAREGLNTDVVVRGSNPFQSYHAHKNILSSASEYLRQHLKRNESSCGKQTLILENLPDELVPLLLQYIYLGWVEIPLGPSVGVWETLMRQMAINIHLPSADRDKEIDEFVARPMQPTLTPVDHTCDPKQRRPCTTEPKREEEDVDNGKSTRSSMIPLRFQSISIPDSNPVSPQSMRVYEEMRSQRQAAESAAREANARATTVAGDGNAQVPRYPPPATPPFSPAELGLRSSHQQLSPGMHQTQVQVVPVGASPFQMQTSPLQLTGPSTSQQRVIGYELDTNDGTVVNVLTTPPHSMTRSIRPLTPSERDAILVMSDLLPNHSPSPAAAPRPPLLTMPTSTPPQIKSEPGIPLPTPPATPQSVSSTPSPRFPRPRLQPALPRLPGQVDPVKNLLPTDQVLVQTIPMKDEQGNDKYWRTLPNGRIRVAITGPVEPLVQKDIDRLNLEREIGGCVCFAVVDPNKGKKAKPGRGRFSVTANGEEKELVPANYVLDGLGREIWSTNDKQFVRCDQEGCTKILTDPSSLYRHKKIHTRDKQHICALCEARFIQRYNMRQHLGTHRNGKLKVSDIYKIDEDLRGFFLSKLENPLEIDPEYVDHPEYVTALYELRDKYLAERSADLASGTQRPRRGGGRRRGTTTVSRARTMTESSTVSTMEAVAAPVPPAAAAEPLQQQQQQVVVQEMQLPHAEEVNQQIGQVNVVGAHVEIGGDDSDTDSEGGYVIDEGAAEDDGEDKDDEEMPMPSSTTTDAQPPPEPVWEKPPPSTPQEESHQEAVNQEAAESSQAAEQRHKDQMRQQALWQREEIRKQLEHFERANLPPAVKEALISQTQTVAAKLDADIEALYKAVD